MRSPSSIKPLAALLAFAVAGAAPAAPIFIAGEATGELSVWNADGKRIDSGETNYSISDGFAVGDVDGDGADEILIGGDVTDDIDIYRQGGATSPRWTWDGGFTIGDALAAGNLMGGPEDEIVVAGEALGYADVFDRFGNLLASFHVDYTVLDGFAVGNVDGVGYDEIVVAGDASGDVDVFAADGTLLVTFAAGFTVSDGFAVGDVDDDGRDEILIAGDATGRIDIFDMNGTLETQFVSSFNISDGFAVGDVDDDGRDEIVVAGDVTGQIDIYEGNGTLSKSFEADFTIADGLAVGRRDYPDMDGDGLLDFWEEFGFDADDDGDIDIDLPAMGATKDHKDLFLELDWTPGREPRRWHVQRMIAAFDVAPANAGGVSNAGFFPGIRLHVDTGSLSDPTAYEGVPNSWGSCANGVDDDNDGAADGMDDTCVEDTGSCTDGIDNDDNGWTDADDPACREGFGSCGDGVDNDADGLVDAADIGDCQVADDLGGGNEVPAIDCLDTVFYATKQANFADERRRIFRYAVASSGDGLDCGGGLGEVGGNDFIELNGDGGTMMHELGHNLGLRHGGDVTANCKPNYISCMNYDNQFSIRRADGSRILDYSPARRSDGTRGDILPAITENALNESITMDPAATSLLMVFSDGSDDKVTALPGAPVDWDGSGMLSGLPVTVNVDTVNSDGDPADCANGATNSTLTDHDDWAVVQLGFRGSAQYDDGAPQPAYPREQTLEEMQRLERALNRTDLAVDVSDAADPAVAGTTLQYVLTASNVGKNYTEAAGLRATIPAGLTPVALDGCHWSPGLLTCDVGYLPAGQERSFAPTFAIDADLVHLAGAPVTLNVSVSLVNAAGDDPVAINNAAAESTQVVAVADLQLAAATTSGVPAELLIGDVATITVEESLGSGGPSSPMDALVSRTASADPGASVTLLEVTELVPAVEQGTTRAASAALDVACSLPGQHGFQVGSSVAPARPDDTDPDLSNNAADAAFAIECVVPVSIRVLPTLSSSRKGVVPVEIRSNEAGEYGLPLAFDAASIIATSVRFGTHADTWANAGGASELHGSTHGGSDRVLHFPMQQAGLPDGEPEACVKGSFVAADGNTYKFFGCDALSWSGR